VTGSLWISDRFLPTQPVLQLLSQLPKAGFAVNSVHPKHVYSPSILLSLHVAPDELSTFILDTGATFLITNTPLDFSCLQQGKYGFVETVNGREEVTGFGIVTITLVGDDGVPHLAQVPTYLVPSSQQRLVSPQAFCQFHGFSNGVDHFGGNGNYFWMSLDADSKIRFRCPISPISNCPVALGRIESPVTPPLRIQLPNRSCRVNLQHLFLSSMKQTRI
jgi:hypothetical protein